METNDAIAKLLGAGIRVRPVGPRTLRTADNELITVHRPSKPPAAVTVKRDLDRADGTVLYLVDRIPPSLIRIAKNDRRVAIVSPDTVWLDKRCIETTDAVLKMTAVRKGPKPYARYAVARALLAPGTYTQSELADRLDITQPSVSNALKQLGALVTRTADGWVPADRRQLLNWVTANHPGAGGITTYWWHDADLEKQATNVIGHAKGSAHVTGADDYQPLTLLSGDLAARRVSAWRVPEHAVIYTRQPIDPAAIGFSMATADDYTLELTMPADPTIWRTSQMFGRQGIADPVIVALDVLRTGSTGDQDEAAAAVTRNLVEVDS